MKHIIFILCCIFSTIHGATTDSTQNVVAPANFTEGGYHVIYKFITHYLATKELPELKDLLEKSTWSSPVQNVLRDILNNYTGNAPLSKTSKLLLFNVNAATEALFNKPARISIKDLDIFISPVGGIIPAKDMTREKLLPYLSFDLRKRITHLLTSHRDKYSLLADIIVNQWYGALDYNENYIQFYKENPLLLQEVATAFLNKLHTLGLKNERAKITFLRNQFLKHIAYISNSQQKAKVKQVILKEYSKYISNKVIKKDIDILFKAVMNSLEKKP